MDYSLTEPEPTFSSAVAQGTLRKQGKGLAGPARLFHRGQSQVACVVYVYVCPIIHCIDIQN